MDAVNNKPLTECSFIIMGGTGDLSKRKLIPAIYNLIAQQQLTTFSVLLVAFSATSAAEILEQARPFISALDPIIWEKLCAATYYHQMDFYNEVCYPLLQSSLIDIEKKHELKGNRIFYLATMPQHFETITKFFAHHGIVSNDPGCHLAGQEPWARVVYEKPFGYDLASAKALNKSITRAFCERCVFRIDHYLGKELVGNIALTRFTNRIFEPLWNHKHIESVHITLSETLGVEGRGAFYDTSGALKDNVQSHMLQILALVAMEAPAYLSAEYIRAAKAAVLKRVVVENVTLGQYDGYLQEKNVDPRSTTETYAALCLKIKNRRWQGVPFYVTTGKKLDKKETSVVITFKPAKCLLNICPVTTNTLTINIAPNEGLFLDLHIKTPGTNNHVQPISMEFCHSCLFGPNTPQAYEVLLVDVINGDQSAFLRADEIELAWKIIAQAQTFITPLQTYAPGSTGPKS
ncbi:MAG: Glucose-6-phosphate 1-dehydrogenase [candidate division TM6 bacterium GW2011_GWF2_38_10]|nr:MAG: Glucose-6-phosphate 1-dehydrogenase [candidate division TM6 bacterium GW2011_GWF2_38_10]